MLSRVDRNWPGPVEHQLTSVCQVQNSQITFTDSLRVCVEAVERRR